MPNSSAAGGFRCPLRFSHPVSTSRDLGVRPEYQQAIGNINGKTIPEQKIAFTGADRNFARIIIC